MRIKPDELSALNNVQNEPQAGKPVQDLTEKNVLEGSRRIYKEVQGTKQMDREQNPEVPLRNLKKGMCSSLRGCVGWYQREGLI